MDAQDHKAQGEPRRQHYVPQFLLKGFAVERKAGKFQIQVFDKQEERSFPSPVENVAAERDFNTAQVGDAEVSWDGNFSKIEDKTAPLIERIRDDRALGSISPDEKARLAVFAALQFVRGVDYRARYAHVGQMLAERLAGDAGEAVPEGLLEEDNDGRLGAMHALNPKTLIEFSAAFAVKHLLLLQAPSGSAFVIGDSPIAMANTKTFGPYGNLGLAVTGIQINLPISSEFTLAFWCTSYMEEVQAQVEGMEKALAKSNGFAILASAAKRAELETLRAASAGPLTRLKTMLTDVRAGRPRMVSAETVDGMNALQIMNAERFVMARAGDFAQAKRMIAENENFKTGLRMTTG